MTIITTATLAEAIKLIEYFKLTKFKQKDFKIYKNKDITLIITNIGETNALKATKYILEHTDNIYQILNIGIAGCTNKNIEIGSLFYINKVINYNNKTTYIEEIKLKNINKCSITSLKTPAIKTMANNINSALVDMESAIFLKTCLEKVQPNQIHILKVVSDHLLEYENERLSKQYIASLIQKNIQNIANFINNKCITKDIHNIVK